MRRIQLTPPARPRAINALQMAALLSGCLSMSALQMVAPGTAAAAPVGLGQSSTSSPIPQGLAPKYFSVANWANSYLPVIATPTTVAITSTAGTGATAVALVVNGKVQGVTVTDPGAGYVIGDAVTVNGTGSGGAGTVTAVDSDGAITAITITTPGSNYDLVTGGTGIRKFVDTLAPLNIATNGVYNPATKNNLDNFIPVAVPDTTTYLGSDYYEIALVEFKHRFHGDLHTSLANGAKVRGYVQLTSSTAPGAVALTYTDGTPIMLPAVPPAAAQQAYGLGLPHYLGPLISATKDRPVRVLFRNLLPTGDKGHLFLPTDVTVMGAGMGPTLDPASETNMQITMCEGMNGTSPTYTKPTGCFAENRATLHMHGGLNPWVSDGTPHQWTVPAGETSTDAALRKGASAQNVPDMPDPGAGALTFFYTNQQSARLMFYHDHAWGITRLNVYAGEAAGYTITDDTEKQLITNGVIPGAADTIPLILQDKTFVPPIPQIAATDPLWDDARWGGEGQLWAPHVYIPAQNPGDASGTNPFGRWNYGLYFHPALTVGTDVEVGDINNPYYDPNCNPDQIWCEPPNMPGTPYLSMTMESYHDTPVINGTAYPKVTLEPKPYRLRILNASNDRFFNLSLYQAVDADGAPCVPGTPPVAEQSGVTCTEVALDPTKLLTALADPTVFPTPVTGLEGPNWIQIGTDSGFLPAPAVIPPQPITWLTDLTLFSAYNVDKHSLLLAPAERADVIIDLSNYVGKTLILYNDAPAAFPARDPRTDYYTNSADNRDTGGAPPTVAGYGPNTRTMMQITVNPTGTPVSFNQTNLVNAFKHNVVNGVPTGAFEASQPPIVVGQSEYNSAYGTNFTANGALNGTVQIQDSDIAFTALANPLTNAGSYVGGPLITMPLQGKAIHDEMNAAWDPIYGRMSGNLGLEPARPPAGLGQQLVLYPYINPPSEILNGIELPPGVSMTPIASATDGTQIWKIAHNGVDTHPLHFHLFDVQVLNRVDWQNLMMKPDANELGWKDTVRVSPLEDTIVAMRPHIPKLPFGLPDSVRLLNPAMMEGSTALFNSTDASGNALPTPITNVKTNFHWEYVLHCHILSHEEMDMMRPMSAIVDTTLPYPPTGVTSTAGTGANAGKNIVTWTDTTPVTMSVTGSPLLPPTLADWGNPANEVGFNILRVNGTSTTYTKIATVPANTTTFTDPAPGTTPKYRVEAFNASGAVQSAVGGAPPANAPPAPTNAVATLQAGPRIRLTWTDNAANEAYFLVERKVASNSAALATAPYTLLAQVPARTAAGSGTVTYFDTTVTSDQAYRYRVSAVNGKGASATIQSAIISPPAIPAAPSALAAATPVRTGKTDSVAMNWTDNATNETGFTIDYAYNATFTSGLVSTPLAANTTTFTQTGLLRHVTYYFRIRANNLGGSSAWSNVVSVITP